MAPKLEIPVNSVIATGVISILLSLINIGSAVAFDIIISMAVGALLLSFIIPISLICWKRISRQELRLGPWHVGGMGLLVNLFALVWLVLIFVFSFFPLVVPVTVMTMNWGSILWIGMSLSAFMWFVVNSGKDFDNLTVEDYLHERR